MDFSSAGDNFTDTERRGAHDCHLRSKIGNQGGISLLITLLILSLLLFLSALTIMYVSNNLRYSGAYKSSRKAFQVAEAGLEEVRARLRSTSTHPISDTYPNNTAWKVYVGTTSRAQEKGYDSSNSAHSRLNSLQSDLDYVVKTEHQMDNSGNILYWGDTNNDGINERTTSSGTNKKNIYLITSYGYADRSTKTLVAEMVRMPPVNTPAALYVNAPATVQGSATISGNDSCGSNNLAGIATSQAVSTVTLKGTPTISGSGGTIPNISHTDTALDLQAMITNLKSSADKQYSVESATQSGTTRPGPGDGWGTLTPGATDQMPSSCSDHHIIYYKATDIHFSGGVSGCGILLVEGNLHLTGGFSWHGLIISTGSVSFTGGGGDNNITGAVLAGGAADTDVVGGNAHIVYCSSAVNNQMDNMPLRYLSWKEQ